MGYALILGANSDIGKVIAEKYAFEGYNLYLADLNADKLEETKQYIIDMCEVEVHALKFNTLEFYTHRNFYKDLDPKPDGVIIASDYTGDHKRSQKDFLEAKKIIDSNYTGLVSILNIVASDFEQRKEGFIIAIGSIIGEQNQKTLYTYSAAKQGFIMHVEGLKERLKNSNVQVLTARPGFVHTKETKDIQAPDQHISIPSDVAEQIFNAQQSRKDSLNGKKNMCQKILSLVGKHK